ncbi:uncharacterized protein LOC124935880 [Impatiens glandulifera]|uniref:uncharacterized protein LOC124935880 n=1 Tax=Impatiens glandulifera TaxID=253017 RepID=UPI001FB13FAB|nr:uncharacterized protein LOC124935880 [Impatiens glandulifera]
MTTLLFSSSHANRPLSLPISNVAPALSTAPFSLLCPPTTKIHPPQYSSSHKMRFSSQLIVASRRNYDDHDNCQGSFNDAVALFNEGDYYKCHDILESLWYGSEEPTRTLVHGILQCAVGFHHLFNQNHKGAMMELGEGLCKLRKLNFESGPFLQFEQDISAVLEFIYQTQLELAACIDDFCLTMDQSDKSYQLLGNFARGQRLYSLQSDLNKTVFIVFSPDEKSYDREGERPRAKLPILRASEDHLMQTEFIRYF